MFFMSNICNASTTRGYDLPNPIRLAKTLAVMAFSITSGNTLWAQNTLEECPKLTGPFLNTCNRN